jgi:hypothetical protein
MSAALVCGGLPLEWQRYIRTVLLRLGCDCDVVDCWGVASVLRASTWSSVGLSTGCGALIRRHTKVAQALVARGGGPSVSVHQDWHC